MKFRKEFKSQMVPEWQEAYMDYSYLKTLLEEIRLFKRRNGDQTTTPSTVKPKPTLYRAFSGLISKPNSKNNSPTFPTPLSDIENQTILVNAVKTDGSKPIYETLFLKSGEEGGEKELHYFKRLDIEFNKVNNFYKSKVEEVMKEAAVLHKQMEALIAFRVKVDNPKGLVDVSKEIDRLDLEVAASTAALSATTPSGARASTSRRISIDVIKEDETSGPSQLENLRKDEEGKEMKLIKKKVIEEESNSIKGTRPSPLEILDRVKINNPHETPRSTIKGLLKVTSPAELSFSKARLKRLQDRLKQAFMEFHHKLRLLKSYSFANIVALSKIMKKYDKITSRNASRLYLEMVDNSELGNSDEVTKLMDRVEAKFIKYFSDSNRRKGMSVLRPKQKKERHIVTFSLGFFAGCVAALLLAIILIIHARHILGKAGATLYMENMFPLYSLLGFIVLHILMYGGNIYFWRRYRVNYRFIFGFKQGTELGYREVFLLSFGLAVLALAGVLANLDMDVDPKTLDYKAFTELIPLGLVLFVIVVLLCPFNIIYRSSRFFFLICLFHCLWAPLYKVTLPDFFLADHITSQVQALRSLEFYVCYYGWGDYKHRQNTCKTNDVFKAFNFIVAAVPYWCRLLQCLRRLFEEKDPLQGFNGLKYFSTIIAICIRTAYILNHGIHWQLLAWITSIIAAAFATYWDVVVDWGLLQRNSKNWLLRDKLLVPHKSVYFAAMVLNILLRFAWLQTVLNFKVPSLHREALITIIASLEIIRRGIWSFFRLENEHLNNVGKYRAFKSVPLPFSYDEDDDKDK